MRRRVLGVIGLAASVVAGCGHHAEPTLQAGTAIQKVSVTVSPVEHRTVEHTVTMVGTLRGWEQVTIGAKKAGRVVKVVHDMGDRVAPGEVLVELDRVDAQLAIDQAETRYLGELVKLGITRAEAESLVERFGINEQLVREQSIEEVLRAVPAVKQVKSQLGRATRDLNRQRQLAARGVGVAQDLENYQNAYDEAEAVYDNAINTARTVIASAMSNRVALAQAKQAFDDTVVRAPTPSSLPAGLKAAEEVRYAVARRQVSEGQMIKEGEAVFDLLIEDPLRLWGSVPERYSEQVKDGQKVRISVAAHPGEEFVGSVVRINPSIDETSRTFQVEVLVPNQARKLRAGGFAKARIVIESAADALVVPIDSVVHETGITKVFVLDEGKVRPVEVTTGIESGGWVEVLGGINTRDRVVLTGQAQLADGTLIEIREPPKEELKEGEGEKTGEDGGGGSKAGAGDSGEHGKADVR